MSLVFISLLDNKFETSYGCSRQFPQKPRLINIHGKKYALTKRKTTLMLSRRAKLLRKFQTRRRKMNN
jgi:hypothetical protein